MYRVINVKNEDNKISLHVKFYLEGIKYSDRVKVDPAVSPGSSDGEGKYSFNKWFEVPITSNKREARKIIREALNALVDMKERFYESLHNSVNTENMVNEILEEEIGLIN